MLEQALNRYRGDLLDGEPVGDWHVEHRDRFQRLYVDGLMQLGALADGGGAAAKAAEAYRRVLARDELHEEALVALMRCHAAVGERAQALRIYARYVERLRKELDCDPGDAAVELAEELQQARLRPSQGAVRTFSSFWLSKRTSFWITTRDAH